MKRLIAILAFVLAAPALAAQAAPGQVIISTKMSTVSGTVVIERDKIYLVGKKRVLLNVIDQSMRDSLLASPGKQRTVTGTPDLVSGTGAFLVTGLR